MMWEEEQQMLREEERKRKVGNCAGRLWRWAKGRWRGGGGDIYDDDEDV